MKDETGIDPRDCITAALTQLYDHLSSATDEWPHWLWQIEHELNIAYGILDSRPKDQP